MNYKKEYLRDYKGFPFYHDDFILCEINGVRKEIQLVSIRVFASKLADSNFTVRYSDTFNNKYSAEELVKGFISFLTPPKYHEEIEADKLPDLPF